MEVRQAVESDIDQIVNIHCSAFKNFFLTSLGEEFLKIYYKSFIACPHGIVFCASKNGNIVGFSATAKFNNGFNFALLKDNLLGFGKIAIKLLIKRPKSLLRLIKNFSKNNDEIKEKECYAELFSIGVRENVQGQGIGKILLLKTEEYLKLEGIRKLSLTTDFYNNESAISFYSKLGYEPLYEFVTYPNRKMYRLIKNIV